MLLVSTYYIEKSCISIHKQSETDVNLDEYSSRKTDRFAILLNLWMYEVTFTEKKRQLLDCYLEAYEHVMDVDERRKLAQVPNIVTYKYCCDYAIMYMSCEKETVWIGYG